METSNRPRILCVEDDPSAREVISLVLRRHFDVAVAASGAEGLEQLDRDADIAVVVSDMRMPVMDGVEFLARVRLQHPDAVRMLLTGRGDLNSAIAAINEGQIFRFLTKPCPPGDLVSAVQAAVEQQRLITAERVLLKQTLHGSIRMLADVLALASPITFGRAMRLKTLVTELADRLDMTERWHVEVAALLSQLGAISLPPNVVEKLHLGEPLDRREQAMVDRLPEVTEQLLANIPRLEAVRAILAGYVRTDLPMRPLSDDPSQRAIEMGARLLHVAFHYDMLESRGVAAVDAIATLRGRNGSCDPAVLDALATTHGAGGEGSIVKDLPLAALTVGMVFAEDVHLDSGWLLCSRGYEVTWSLLERMRNLKPGSVAEPLRVIVRA